MEIESKLDWDDRDVIFIFPEEIKKFALFKSKFEKERNRFGKEIVFPITNWFEEEKFPWELKKDGPIERIPLELKIPLKFVSLLKFKNPFKLRELLDTIWLLSIDRNPNELIDEEKFRR